jgi:hypothetical protein
LGHLAGCFEIGNEFLHVGVGSSSVTALGRVAEVHDCILGCVTQETGSLQFSDGVPGGNGFEVKLGLFVDGSKPGNLRVHVIFLGWGNGDAGTMLAFVAIFRLRGVLFTVFSLGICS